MLGRGADGVRSETDWELAGGIASRPSSCSGRNGQKWGAHAATEKARPDATLSFGPVAPKLPAACSEHDLLQGRMLQMKTDDTTGRWKHKGRGDASGEPVHVEEFRDAPKHLEPEPEEWDPSEADWRPKHPRLFSLHVGRDA